MPTTNRLMDLVGLPRVTFLWLEQKDSEMKPNQRETQKPHQCCNSSLIHTII